MKFELVEPLREFFKDEVRQAGSQLGLPNEIVQRQPFLGPDSLFESWVRLLRSACAFCAKQTHRRQRDESRPIGTTASGNALRFCSRSAGSA